MFDPEQMKAWFDHAISEYPRESCGFFNKQGVYIACLNRAADPENDWLIHYRDFIGHHVAAIVHSHPGIDEIAPSGNDMRSQLSWSIPFGVVATDGAGVSPPVWWGEGVPAPALLGRPYVHGVYDCYTFSRDCYRMIFDVHLPEYPRDPWFWKRGEDMYQENFREAGFEVIDKREVRVGDGLLFALDSKQMNHSGIIIPGDRPGSMVMGHHMMDKISRRGPIGPWLEAAVAAVRWSGWESEPEISIMVLDQALNKGEAKS